MSLVFFLEVIVFPFLPFQQLVPEDLSWRTAAAAVIVGPRELESSKQEKGKN